MAMRRQVRDGGIQLDAMSYGAAVFACEKVGLKKPWVPGGGFVRAVRGDLIIIITIIILILIIIIIIIIIIGFNHQTYVTYGDINLI